MLPFPNEPSLSSFAKSNLHNLLSAFRFIIGARHLSFSFLSPVLYFDFHAACSALIELQVCEFVPPGY
jgi:hypothetical protein